MNLIVSPAIVLHHTDYGEADRIATLLTPGHGRVKGFARNARKSRKRFGTSLEMFAEVILQWTVRSGSDLVSLREAELIRLRTGLRRDLATLALASYGCELTAALFDETVGAAGTFVLLQAFLDHLDERGSSVEARLLLEMRLLSQAGYIPHLQHCAMCDAALPAGAVGFCARLGGSLCDSCGGRGADLRVDRMTLGTLGRILQTPVDLFDGIRLSPLSRSEGLAVAAQALRCHLPGPLKSQAFMADLNLNGEA